MLRPYAVEFTQDLVYRPRCRVWCRAPARCWAWTPGRRENLAALEGRIDLVEGDVRSYHLVRQALEGIDFVLHQAALPSVHRSVLDPITTDEVKFTMPRFDPATCLTRWPISAWPGARWVTGRK